MPLELNTTFLADYKEEEAIGPVQREEALFLYALTRLIRPRLVVEIGVREGHSTRCFLEAGATVVAIDIKYNHHILELRRQYRRKFSFVRQDQGQLTGDEWGKNRIDLCFLDASHNLNANKKTFEAIEPYMNFNSYMVIHDTGIWVREHMTPAHRKFAQANGKDVRWGHMHQPGEIDFIKWLRERGKYDIVDLASTNCIRHGMTLVAFKHPRPTTVLPIAGLPVLPK